jgi:phage-related protein
MLAAQSTCDGVPAARDSPEPVVYRFWYTSFLSWTVETLNGTVDAEVEALPEDMRARLARIALLIEEKGLERVGGPHVQHIEGRLWEMRMKGKSRISRALYVAT